MFIMGATSQDNAVGAVVNLQWAWDRRKTKADDIAERSMQKTGQVIFQSIQNALSDSIGEVGWERAAKQFGGCVKT